MTFLSWLTLFFVCCLGAMAPGPSLAVVMKNTLAGSRLHGLITAVAHGTGICFYAILSVTGLALVLKSMPVSFHILMGLGAIYLIWMGMVSLSAKGSISHKVKFKHSTMSLKKAAFDGLAISFFNPKVILFFLALFSQFVRLSGGSHTGSWIMVCTSVTVDVLWYTLVALLLSQGKAMTWLNQRAIWIDKIMGVVFLGLAINIILMFLR